MTYDFDRPIDRKGTDCVKYDLAPRLFGKEDLLQLWVADMDFESPEVVRQAVVRRAQHPIYGYTLQSERFLQAAQGWVRRRHGWEIGTESILYSPGVVPALAMLVHTFTKRADRVLIHTPVYPPFHEVVLGQDRELVCCPMLQDEEGDYALDFARMEQEFAQGVRLMIFCHPHNPVGRVWTRGELERLMVLCECYDVLVVSDEIHSDLLLFGHRHIPLASLSPQAAARTITCMAPSKTFNLAGMSAAFTVIENETLRARYRKEMNTFHLFVGNTFGTEAFIAAYEQAEPWLDALLPYLEQNVLLVEQYLSRMPGLRMCRPQATYLLWIDFRGLGLDRQALRALAVERAGLAMNEGHTFGTEGDGFFRMNVACPRPMLERALQQLEAALAEGK